MKEKNQKLRALYSRILFIALFIMVKTWKLLRYSKKKEIGEINCGNLLRYVIANNYCIPKDYLRRKHYV